MADCGGDVAAAITITFVCSLLLFIGYIYCDRRFFWTNAIISIFGGAVPLGAQGSSQRHKRKITVDSQLSTLGGVSGASSPADFMKDYDDNNNNNINKNGKFGNTLDHAIMIDEEHTTNENSLQKNSIDRENNNNSSNNDTDDNTNEEEKQNNKEKKKDKNNYNSNKTNNLKIQNLARMELDLASGVATSDIIGLSDTEGNTPIPPPQATNKTKKVLSATAAMEAVYSHGTIGGLHKRKNNPAHKTSGQMMASIIGSEHSNTAPSKTNNGKNSNNNVNNNLNAKNLKKHNRLHNNSNTNSGGSRPGGVHSVQQSTDSAAGFIVLVDNLSNITQGTVQTSGYDNSNNNDHLGGGSYGLSSTHQVDESPLSDISAATTQSLFAVGANHLADRTNNSNKHKNHKAANSANMSGATIAMGGNSNPKPKRKRKKPPKHKTRGIKGRSRTADNRAQAGYTGKRSTVILASGRVPIHRMGSLNKHDIKPPGLGARSIGIIDENAAMTTGLTIDTKNSNLNTIIESPAIGAVDPVVDPSKSPPSGAVQTRNRKRSQSEQYGSNYYTPLSGKIGAGTGPGLGGSGVGAKSSQIGEEPGIEIQLFELYSDQNGKILSPMSYHYAMQMSKKQARLRKAQSNVKHAHFNSRGAVGGPGGAGGGKKKRKGKHGRSGTVGQHKMGRKLMPKKRLKAAHGHGKHHLHGHGVVAPIVEENESDLDRESHNNIDLIQPETRQKSTDSVFIASPKSILSSDHDASTIATFGFPAESGSVGATGGTAAGAGAGGGGIGGESSMNKATSGGSSGATSPVTTNTGVGPGYEPSLDYPRLSNLAMNSNTTTSMFSYGGGGDDISFQGSYHPPTKRLSHITDEWSYYEESHRFTFESDEFDDEDDDDDDEDYDDDDEDEDDDDEDPDSEYDMARVPSDGETVDGDEESRMTVTHTMVTNTDMDHDHDDDGDEPTVNEYDAPYGHTAANANGYVSRNEIFEHHMQEQQMSKNLVLSIKTSMTHHQYLNDNNDTKNLSDIDSGISDMMASPPPDNDVGVDGIADWTYRDVSTWLKDELLNDESISLNVLRKILLKFEMNYVSGNVLLVLDQQALHKMGITKSHMAEKILKLTQKLKDSAASSAATTATNTPLYDEDRKENDYSFNTSINNTNKKHEETPVPTPSGGRFYKSKSKKPVDSLEVNTTVAMTDKLSNAL